MRPTFGNIGSGIIRQDGLGLLPPESMEVGFTDMTLFMSTTRWETWRDSTDGVL
ncbi:MAG: hypothetical protein II838_13630 [Lachnospiraceae bacterium]|nr:hypothetical protein [Lachnospiraceae bacterium]